MKANGIHPNGGQVDNIPQKAPTPLKQKSKDSSEKGSSAKKRKTGNGSPVPEPAGRERTQKQPTMSKCSQPEALSHEPPPAVSVLTGMPPVSSQFFPRPMQGYMVPNPSTRPSFSTYPPPGHTPSASMQPGMYAHGPFALSMHAAMSLAGPQRNVPPGFDRFINQEAFFQPQAPLPPDLPSPISAETLPTILPPQPQEIEPLYPHRASPTTANTSEKHPGGHVVIVD